MAVKEVKNKQVNVRVKDTNQFYSNDASVNVSPTEFVIDFKCITQVQDMANHSALMIGHNPIILTPYQANNIVELLTKAVKDYEKKFGKIEKPKAVKKAEKIIEKKSKETKSKEITPKTESYFG